ncbi:hypothetical protein [Streptomyces sp. NBC_00258]|uniref:hypothetical protein n=1 Tax=Streptomyces sp. NBC_00258 TaxID=2903642 RepID=UPI002E2C2CCA|nr:hypothetical protein [Streptomyces sp. NBC_00258]
MPRRWSLGVDRILSDGLDGDCDRNKKTAKAHSLHDTDPGVKPSRPGGSSGPSSSSANTSQKKGWRR